MHVILEILLLLCKIFLCYIQAFVELFYKSKKDISGRTAVLTGGGGGIGECLALELVQRKVKLALWDVNKAAVDKVKNELIEKGFSNVFSYQCDITKKAEVQRVAAETRKDLGDIDFLFNNAGVLYAKDIVDQSEAEVRRTMEVNSISLFWTIQEFLPSMLKKNYGHIVNTASVAGKIGAAMLTDYCASKHAVIGLSEALRLEIHRKGKDVKVTAVCPYIVDTPMVTNAAEYCKPHARFDEFLSPSHVAKMFLEGVERDEFTVYVPAKTYATITFSMLLPRKADIMLGDFLQAGYFPKDYKFN